MYSNIKLFVHFITVCLNAMVIVVRGTVEHHLNLDGTVVSMIPKRGHEWYISFVHSGQTKNGVEFHHYAMTRIRAESGEWIIFTTRADFWSYRLLELSYIPQCKIYYCQFLLKLPRGFNLTSVWTYLIKLLF